MTLGERLRQLRKEKKMTLRVLAEAAGVDFTYLSKIENGKAGYSPGADTIRVLAGVLGVDSLDACSALRTRCRPNSGAHGRRKGRGGTSAALRRSPLPTIGTLSWTCSKSVSRNVRTEGIEP